MAVNSLIYDGVNTSIPNTTFKYKWATTTPAVTYKMFAAYLTTNSTSTEAHYRPKKGVTIIMSIPIDLDDNDADDACDARPTRQKITGFVVPYMQTNKGTVSVSY
jgi:hypothetical protein